MAAQVDKLQHSFGDDLRATSAAQNLLKTLENLHLTAIVALANAGFLARDELAKCVSAIANGGHGSHNEEILTQAHSAAIRAVAVLQARPKIIGKSTRRAPNNDLATAVAGIAYRAYAQLTGKLPTIRVSAIGDGHAGSGPFLDFLKDLLLALNIKGSPEALARKVIRQRRLGHNKIPTKLL